MTRSASGPTWYCGLSARAAVTELSPSEARCPCKCTPATSAVSEDAGSLACPATSPRTGGLPGGNPATVTVTRQRGARPDAHCQPSHTHEHPPTSRRTGSGTEQEQQRPHTCLPSLGPSPAHGRPSLVRRVPGAQGLPGVPGRTGAETGAFRLATPRRPRAPPQRSLSGRGWKGQAALRRAWAPGLPGLTNSTLGFRFCKNNTGHPCVRPVPGACFTPHFQATNQIFNVEN